MKKFHRLLNSAPRAPFRWISRVEVVHVRKGSREDFAAGGLCHTAPSSQNRVCGEREKVKVFFGLVQRGTKKQTRSERFRSNSVPGPLGGRVWRGGGA